MPSELLGVAQSDSRVLVGENGGSEHIVDVLVNAPPAARLEVRTASGRLLGTLPATICREGRSVFYFQDSPPYAPLWIDRRDDPYPEERRVVRVERVPRSAFSHLGYPEEWGGGLPIFLIDDGDADALTALSGFVPDVQQEPPPPPTTASWIANHNSVIAAVRAMTDRVLNDIGYGPTRPADISLDLHHRMIEHFGPTLNYGYDVRTPPCGCFLCAAFRMEHE